MYANVICKYRPYRRYTYVNVFAFSSPHSASSSLSTGVVMSSLLFSLNRLCLVCPLGDGLFSSAETNWPNAVMVG